MFAIVCEKYNVYFELYLKMDEADIKINISGWQVLVD